MKKTGLCFLLLLIMMVTISGCANLYDYLVFEPLQLPETTGPYGVGTFQIRLTDPERKETFLKDSPGTFRRIMVRFWYPTVKTLTDKTADYLDHQTALYFTKGSGIVPDDVFKIVDAIKTNSIENAPIAEGQFPILLFSPGLNSAYDIYQTFLEEAASHGYIVAAVNHPFISAITIFPDGSYQKVDPSMDKQGPINVNFPTVVADLKFVIARLKELNSDSTNQFYNKMDLSKIGSFGHSFGGAASVRLAMETSECKAAANFDGWLEGEGYNQRLRKPLLFLAGDRYTDSTDPKWNTVWSNLETGFKVKIKGASHINFSDYGTVMHHFFPRVPARYFVVYLGDITYWRLGKIEPGLAVKIANNYLVAFFNHTLKDEPVEALKNISSKYNVVKFEMK